MTRCRFAFIWHRPISDIFINKDAFSITDRLSRKGYNVYLIVPKFNVNIIDYNFNVIEVNNSSRGRIGAILWGFKVFKVLRSIRPDIVMFLHLYIGNIISGVLYKFSRLGHIFLYIKLDYSGKPPRNLFKKIFFIIKLYIVLFIFDLVSIETRCAYNKLLEWAKVPNFLIKKIIILPDGYNDLIFKPANSLRDLRDKSIVIVSRVNKSKGIDLVVKALAMLGDIGRSWKIIIVGPIEDKNYYKEILDEAKRLGVEVEFVGYKSPGEIKEYLARASIFVLPSYSESFGLARVEAAAVGLPVVTTATPCSDDLEGMGFIVVPIGDVNALARTLRDLILDRNLRKAVAARQITKIKSWSEIVDKLLSHIKARSNVTCSL